MKQKLFTLFLALITGIGITNASNTSVGGIWYNFNSSNKTATVTYRGSAPYDYNGEYSGSVVIPSSVTYNGTTYRVTSIGDAAFVGCSSLTSVTIPNSVTSIGDGAFSGCSSLTSVSIGNSVTSIREYAFKNCSKLTSIAIPNSVTSIGKSAFSGCSKLTSIAIPNSVTSIGLGAFEDCSSLTSVILTASSEGDFCKGQGNSLLYTAGTRCRREIQINGNKVTDFAIPNSVTSIGEYTFWNCSSLTSVSIGNSVTSIGKSAFSGCSKLTSIAIPNSVTSIGLGAFEDCSSLRRMIFKGVNPPNRSGLDSDGPHPICYVPCGALEAYALKFHAVMAQFVEQSPYLITINSSNDAYGIAKAASRPDCNSAILTAIPNEGCTFVKWSDGNTQATRYLELIEDITLTAYFAKEGCTIHVYQDCNTTIE